MQQAPHIPVMLNEVIQYMAPKDGEVYVDGTFGAGGYSRAILEAADCKVYAIDRDPNVKKIADELSKEFGGRIELLQGKFSEVDELLNAVGVDKIDGIVLDIGVSSMQIDEADRGFSFMKNGPLDMRMSAEGIDAAYFVNNNSEEEIANVIYKYGGERKSRRIAREIVKQREEAPIETTGQLANIVRSVVRKGKDKIDPATRTFQALRIWVNNELEELEVVLEKAENLLSENGRLVVVTFHSLEDSIVKSFINEKSGKTQSISRHMPIEMMDRKEAVFESISRKAIKPTDDEIKINVRSRSAKLRAAKKLKEGGQ